MTNVEDLEAEVDELGNHVDELSEKVDDLKDESQVLKVLKYLALKPGYEELYDALVRFKLV